MMGDARFKWHQLADTVPVGQQVILVRLMEECAEVQQACSKILRFGTDSFNPLDANHPGNRAQLFAEMENLTECITEARRVVDAYHEQPTVER